MKNKNLRRHKKRRLKIIRFPEVCEKRGKSRVQTWRDVRDGKFPAPVQLGPNSVGWFEHEVDANLEGLPRVHWAKSPQTGAECVPSERQKPHGENISRTAPKST
jgi:prophage regulatory protein